MAENLTPQQRRAVTDRGGKLLVSAAAGSGKTKVLVDRLLSYVLDEQIHANIDDFLLITYTKAAAAELRGKIAAKLTERIALAPENRHLQRQLQRLYLAKISTVHGFCAEILKEYAYRLDIPADFRVADEDECGELRGEALSKVLDEAYLTGRASEAFLAFADTQGLGRDDRLVPEIVLQVYDASRCHLNPEAWLEKCVSTTQLDGQTDAGATIWGRYLIDDLMDYLDLQIAALRRCAEAAALAQKMEKHAALLEQTVQQLEALRAASTWDEIVHRKALDFGRMPPMTKLPDQELAGRIKATREACKKGLARKLKNFSDLSATLLEDMRACALPTRGLVELVQEFSHEYSRRKRRRRVLDFSDLEHCALDLLTGRSRSTVTAAAREIGGRFREVMVDEYQDSNAVQDCIFCALTQERQNCFLVGDVKQSIYRFRLADPTIFIEKYISYSDSEENPPLQPRKILLSSNFRSCGAVLDAVNDIFRATMSPRLGGLRYGEQEALREGLPHAPLPEPEVELLALDVRADTYAEEAAMVASRIRELLDGTHCVRDGEALRPIRPEDIAILLRSPGSVGAAYTRALAALGIRCVCGGGEDMLQTPEISALHALLQVIQNPRRDIPLLAALAGPVFGFTAQELAELRVLCPEGGLYDALAASRSEKAVHFLAVLSRLRDVARTEALPRLLDEIFRLTGMDSLFAAMEGGEARADNLRSFCRMAGECPGDLGDFLESLDALRARGLPAAGADAAAGAVTLMSIHKSKGLEFPVVFVSGLSRAFNREDVRAQVLCDKDMGLGLAAVDAHVRVRYPSLAKRAIAVKTAAESLSEELRVLYVALTRAKDRLIMTYAEQNLDAELLEQARRIDLGGMELLARDAVCPGQWVLMSALQRIEAGELFIGGERPAHLACARRRWRIRRVSAAPEAAPAAETPELPCPHAATEIDPIRRGLQFSYPHLAATRAPSKQTATSRKGRDRDEEAAQDTPAPRARQRTWRKPSFVEAAPTGAAIGTATHLAMQYLRYERCGSVEAVQEELARLQEENWLTPQQRQMVDARCIARFFASPLGKWLLSRETVYREFKFSILTDGGEDDPALAGEKLLLQGVVDCFAVEPDGITVLDFKTDFVTPDTLAEKAAYYRPQVEAYAHALRRIFGLRVKKTYLYFFRLDQAVAVEETAEDCQ